MNDLKMLWVMVKRNVKLYFNDKGSFFTSLITPLILLALFVTFLNNVYKSSLVNIVGNNGVSEQLINAFSGGWLLSSLLGVCCVTIAFCSNVQVNDRISGAILDLESTPVKKRVIALSYFISNFFTTFIICFVAMVVGFVYLGIIGWYLSVVDIFLIFVNMILCVLFGTLLASIVESFISTQGGLASVSTLVSSLYGFLCGAYMPISQFAEGIRNFVMFIPGTYGVVLFRNYYMNGVIEEFSKELPGEMVKGVKDSFDGNVYFFGNQVELWQMYLILGVSIIALIGIYLLVIFLKNKGKKER